MAARADAYADWPPERAVTSEQRQEENKENTIAPSAAMLEIWGAGKAGRTVKQRHPEADWYASAGPNSSAHELWASEPLRAGERCRGPSWAQPQTSQESGESDLPGSAFVTPPRTPPPPPGLCPGLWSRPDLSGLGWNAAPASMEESQCSPEDWGKPTSEALPELSEACLYGQTPPRPSLAALDLPVYGSSASGIETEAVAPPPPPPPPPLDHYGEGWGMEALESPPSAADTAEAFTAPAPRKEDLQPGAAGHSLDTTLMFRAATGGHVEVCALLLGRGAVVLARDASGATALHRAAEGGHAKVCALLLDHGARLGAKDAEGETALQRAAQGGHVETCKLLRDRDIAKREEKAARKASKGYQ